jgi:hypothetical protein
MATQVNVAIYSPDDLLRATAFESEDLWGEDTWTFRFAQSIGDWGGTAQVRFDWGQGSHNVVWLTINGGTLVKIKGVKHVSLG